MRVFLVYPTFAVYPQLVPTVQLFDALHRGKSAVLQKKRLRFFWGIFIAIFVWEWFPEYIAPCVPSLVVFVIPVTSIRVERLPVFRSSAWLRRRAPG